MTPEEQESSLERARRTETLWWLRPRSSASSHKVFVHWAWRRRRYHGASPAVRSQDDRRAEGVSKAWRNRARLALTDEYGPWIRSLAHRSPFGASRIRFLLMNDVQGMETAMEEHPMPIGNQTRQLDQPAQGPAATKGCTGMEVARKRDAGRRREELCVVEGEQEPRVLPSHRPPARRQGPRRRGDQAGDRPVPCAGGRRQASCGRAIRCNTPMCYPWARTKISGIGAASSSARPTPLMRAVCSSSR